MNSQDQQFDDDDEDMLDADFGDEFGDDIFDDDDEAAEQQAFDDGFGDELGDEFVDETEEEEDPYAFDDWDDDDDDDDGEELTPGLRKTSNFEVNLSFNAIAIIVALTLGVLVLGYQLITNKPEAVERFISAIGMVGLTDGPIFGQEKEEDTNNGTLTMDQVQDHSKQKTGGNNDQGFLYEPDILKNMEMAPRIEDAPPMPTPIIATVEDETAATDAQPVSDSQVPRSPPDYGAIFENRDKESFADTPVDNVANPKDSKPENLEAEAKRSNTSVSNDASKQSDQTQDGFDQNDLALPKTVEETANQDTVKNEKMGNADPFADALSSVTGDVMEDTGLGVGLGVELGLDDIASDTTPLGMHSSETQQTPMSQESTEIQQDAQKNTKPVAKETFEEDIFSSETTENAMQQDINSISSQETNQETNPVLSQLQEAQQRIKELQKSEDSYRTEIETLKARIEELSNQSAIMAQNSKSESKSESQAQTETQPKTQSTSTTPKKVQKKKTSKRKSTKSSGQWELRAAMPGKAWIAKKNQRILVPITVGDTVEGMGQVRSINMVSGRWVIKTSKGQIRQ